MHSRCQHLKNKGDNDAIYLVATRSTCCARRTGRRRLRRALDVSPGRDVAVGEAPLAHFLKFAARLRGESRKYTLPPMFPHPLPVLYG